VGVTSITQRITRTRKGGRFLWGLRSMSSSPPHAFVVQWWVLVGGYPSFFNAQGNRVCRKPKGPDPGPVGETHHYFCIFFVILPCAARPRAPEPIPSQNTETGSYPGVFHGTTRKKNPYWARMGLGGFIHRNDGGVGPHDWKKPVKNPKFKPPFWSRWGKAEGTFSCFFLFFSIFPLLVSRRWFGQPRRPCFPVFPLSPGWDCPSIIFFFPPNTGLRNVAFPPPLPN